MGYRCLDLTIVCAEGLKDVNLFTAMDVYVVVQLLGHGRRENKKRTHIDRNGGTNPRWNHRIKFTIDEPSLKNNPTLSALFQLKSERIFGSDRIIGEVTIPMKELYDDWVGADNINSERVVDYQVRTSSGKPKGTLKISYKFGEKYVNHQPPPPPPPEDNYKRNGVYEPVTAFPSVAGTSTAYAPYPAAGMGYAAAYPGYGGYPRGPPAPPPGYPLAVAPAGYNAYAPPVHPVGYGYPAPPKMQQQQPKKNKGKMGMGAGLGLGLGAGLLGGMLVGDMVSDVGEMAAYSEGYSDAMGDGGFDF